MNCSAPDGPRRSWFFDCDAVPQPGLMWQASVFRHDSSFESGRSLDNQRVMGLEKSNAVQTN